VLHNDDFVLPGFYARLREGLERNPNAGAAFCRHISTDEDGMWMTISRVERKSAGWVENWLPKIAVENRLECPSIVVNRAVYEALGGFRLELFYAPDWEMWIRAASRYPFWYEPTPLACYRRHLQSGTAAVKKGARDLADVRRAIEITQLYLPAEAAPEIYFWALRLLALRALETAERLLLGGQFSEGCAYVREAWRADHKPRMLANFASLPCWYAAMAARRGAGRIMRSLFRRIRPLE
jgi:hypothetical protein